MDFRVYNLFTHTWKHLIMADKTLQILDDDSSESSLQAEYLAVPGLLDLQVNGYGGHDYSSPKLSTDDVTWICEQMVTIGTIYHLPTVITRPQQAILNSLETIEAARRRNTTVDAGVVGYHIEGPYISDIEGPRGAHDAAYIRDPDIGEYREWQAAAADRIRIVTVAPERRGSIAFIERLVEDGVVAAIGHSAATPEEIRSAVEAGARMSTHLGNGSHRTVPRLHNYIWEQLAADNLTAGIIADGFHLPDAVIKTIHRTKGPNRIVLVSDLSPMAGLPPGSYVWDKIDIEVGQDGRIGVLGSPYFAGAWRSLATALPVFMRATGATPAETFPLVTTVPADTIGIGEWYRNLSTSESVTVFSLNQGERSYRPILSALNGTVLHQAQS